MAVAYLQSGDLGGFASNANPTATPTITSGTNMVGFVFVEQSSLAIFGNPSSVTWGGVAMTLVQSATESSARNGSYSLWALKNPSTGSQTIAWNFPGAYNSHATYGTIQGADTTLAVTSYPNASNVYTSNNGITLNLTPSTSNSIIVGFSLDLASTRTANAGTTVDIDANWSVFHSVPNVSSQLFLGFSSFNAAAMAVALGVAVAPSTGSPVINSGFFNFM